MEEKTKKIIYKLIGSVSMSAAVGFIFMVLLELIIDLKDFHMKRGLLYMDGVPSFILAPLVFFILLLYPLPDKLKFFWRVVRSLLLAGAVTYVLSVMILVADVSTMQNKIILWTIVMVSSFIGFLFLEMYFRKDQLAPPKL